LAFVNLGVILDLQTKSCDAVVDGSNVLFAADSFQNNGCNFCEVVICENHFLLCFLIVILTSRCLQIKFCDRETEHYIEYEERSDSQRDDQQCFLRCRKGSGEKKVSCSGGATEASTESKGNCDHCEDRVQKSVDHVQCRSQEHETEFEGLCNTADKGCDSCGSHKTDGNFLLVALCCMYHSESRAGDTEHHAGEES